MSRDIETQTLIDRNSEAISDNRESIADNRYSISNIERSIEKLVEERRKNEKSLAETRRKNEESLAEERRKNEKSLAEAQRKTEASIDKLSEENRKVAEAQRKTEATVDRTSKTVDALCKRMDNAQKASGALAHIQGKIAEDLFFRNAVTQLRFRFIPVTNVTRNPFVFDREFDLVVHNGPRKPLGFLRAAWIVLIEIKNRPTDDDVKRLIEQQMPQFMEGLRSESKVKQYTVIGAIGGLIVHESAQRYAEKNGIYVLTQRSEDGASIVNADDFIPRDFATGKDARIPSELPVTR